MNKEFQKLKAISTKTHYLEGISHLLDWDSETYMPENAADSRGEQLKALSGVIHKQKTSKKFSNALSKLIDLKSGRILSHELPERNQKALLRYREDYIKDTSLPTSFVENFAKLTNQSIQVWRVARKENNFKLFLPYLKKIVEANKKKADYLKFQNHPYDPLLGLYEPKMTLNTLSPLFEDLKTSIKLLLKKNADQINIDDSSLFGDFEEEKQLEVSRLLLAKIGYDLKSGRLDISTHPFSSSPHPTDSRVTTRLNRKNVFQNILTVLHEAGHSLYEMGLPVSDFGTPLAQAVSMGIHESQSRFWETRIGLSKPFWEFFLPILQTHFPSLQKVSAHEVYKAINKVEPTFIRVEADEMTYPLHVILRFELEKALIEGTLDPKDVPSAWNEKMKNFLGITPPNNTLGCLQDIHWAMGAFGYFPTYLLGNLYAAEIFEVFKKRHPTWEELVKKGEFEFIKKFLHEHIYRYGREFESQELIEKLTKRPFSASSYIDILSLKFQ